MYSGYLNGLLKSQITMYVILFNILQTIDLLLKSIIMKCRVRSTLHVNRLLAFILIKIMLNYQYNLLCYFVQR